MIIAPKIPVLRRTTWSADAPTRPSEPLRGRAAAAERAAAKIYGFMITETLNATVPDGLAASACARRNCDQVGPVRRARIDAAGPEDLLYGPHD
jgi:hypothetical protein